MAVVGQATQPGAENGADLGELFAFLIFSDRADRIDAHVPFDARFRQDELDLRNVVDRGLGDRHAGDRCKSAHSRRRRSRRDRFLFFLTGLAQVHVHVDQARRHDFPRGVVELHLVGSA